MYRSGRTSGMGPQRSWQCWNKQEARFEVGKDFFILVPLSPFLNNKTESIMSILLNKNSKIVVQGITGRSGLFHTQLCREYGTKVVAGVTPGKGGIHIEGIPVFNTVQEAVHYTKADVSMIFVPPPAAADAILEAADAGIELAICITEGIPVRDMVLARRQLEGKKMRLVGPNCPGVITP